MKPDVLVASMLMVAFSASLPGATAELSSADKAAAFKSAGFKLKGKQWQNCQGEEPPTEAAYDPGAIQEVRDLNGDGRPEAVITEGGDYCFGRSGSGYSIVSKQVDRSWKLITNGTGIPAFLGAKGVGGWPDIEIGGPGLCFPVMRWNGKEYKLHRHQYDGKRCKPQY
jgi:hypothetical protein